MQTESAFQVAVVRMLRTAGFFVFAVPNGGSRNAREAHNLRLQGVMPGVSDLVVLLPEGRAVFIELKNINGKGRQSQAQKDFEARAGLLGHEYLLWASWADVERFINERRQAVACEPRVGGTD